MDHPPDEYVIREMVAATPGWRVAFLDRDGGCGFAPIAAWARVIRKSLAYGVKNPSKLEPYEEECVVPLVVHDNPPFELWVARTRFGDALIGIAGPDELGGETDDHWQDRAAQHQRDLEKAERA